MSYRFFWPASAISFLLFAATVGSFTQSAPPRAIDDSAFINTIEEPAFPGGSKALVRYLSQQVRYPKAAAEAGISGRVFVSFVIDTTGCIYDLIILKRLGYGCDEEAIRIVREMPRWKPGKESGRVVRVKYNLPVQFPPTSTKRP